MKSNNDFDAILDNATAEIQSETVESPVVDKAAERVWARLSAETSELKTERAAADRIGNCEDFQSLIPAYLTGSLSEARSLLLVDHTHECIPCRKAMKDARSRKMAPARRQWQAAATAFSQLCCAGELPRLWLLEWGSSRFRLFNAGRRSEAALKRLCRPLKDKSFKLPTLVARL